MAYPYDDDENELDIANAVSDAEETPVPEEPEIPSYEQSPVEDIDTEESLDNSFGQKMSAKAPSESDPRLSKYEDFMNQYKALQDQRKSDMDKTNLIAGLSMIGQGLARGRSAGYKSDASDVLKIGQQRANQPVTDFEQAQGVKAKGIGLEDEMDARDPNSHISKVYRDYATKRLGFKDAEGNSTLEDNVSAYDLQALLKGIGRNGDTAKTKPQLSQYLSKITGNPVIYDQSNNRMVDAVTGEVVPTGQFVKNYTTKDAKGDLVYAGGPGQAPVIAVPSQYSPVSEMAPKQLEKFQPNKEQRDALSEVQKSVNKQTEIAQKQFNAISKLKKTLMSGNKLTGAVVRTQMPRLSGEVGNLNESEQQVWTGSQAIDDRIEQWLETHGESEITPENRKQLLGLIDTFEGSIKDATSQAKSNAQQQLEINYAIPRTFSDKGLTAPSSLEKKNLVKKEYNKQTNKTRLTYSDGTKEVVDGKK